MKVLMTTDWYAPAVNGVVASVCTLAQALRARGHEVRILTLSGTHHSHSEGDVFYAASLGVGRIYPGARLRLPDFRRSWRNFCGQRQGSGRAECWQPDIVHSQCEFSTFPLAKRIAAALDVPLVHTYHTMYEDYTHYLSLRKAWGARMVRRLTQRLSLSVSAIVVPSTKMSQRLVGFGVYCPLYVVPSGINLAMFKAASGRESVRQQYGVAPDDLLLLYVGRLAREKNVAELVGLVAKTPGVHLLIVGDGPARGDLEAQVRALALTERVRFAGMVAPQTVARYYQAGDLFVSASTSETQGLTYGEALASGLPLLCRADDCLRGVVTEGVNGWQYEDAAQFQARLRCWLRLDETARASMKEAACASAQMFSVAAFGEHMEQVYKEVLQDHERRRG